MNFSSKEDVVLRDLATAKRLIDDNSETPENLLKLGQQIISNVDNHGAKTWYQWAIPNWGTKWNAYDVNVADAQVTLIPLGTHLSLFWTHGLLNLN